MKKIKTQISNQVRLSSNQDGQFRDTGNIGHTRHGTKTHQTKINTTQKTTNKGNNKITELEQSYKGKVKTHKYINRQNQSTTGKL